VTLSDTMLFTFPGSWFRMLSSIRGEDSANRTRCQLAAVTAKMRRPLLKACALQVRRVKRVALVKITSLVAAAEPAGSLFGYRRLQQPP
jgi:hypothetical protein